MQFERIQQYLQRLSPLSRGNLLTELERLEICGEEMPGSAEIIANLRAELRKDGSAQSRVANASRYFFLAVEPLLVNGAPDHANSGHILRGSLPPIWEWISRDLLPTMARDYVTAMNDLIAADNQREARQTAASFQIKVVKVLESTLSSPDGCEQTRARLATYTAAPAAYGDLCKMVSVLRTRDALTKFANALPAKIDKFENAPFAKVKKLLDDLGEKNAEALPFALALVGKRLKKPWELIRLATKASPSKNAADIAATPYAIAISMVLDRLDDQRALLRMALKKNRTLVAKEILINIYDIEYALQVHINMLEESAWGKRLEQLMSAIAALVEAEVKRFPDKLGHVLTSRNLRSHQSLSGRLTHLVWKSRDALNAGAGYFRKLLRQPEESSA